MKRAFLALLLMLLPITGRSTDGLGQHLEINGSIDYVKADSNVIRIGATIYAVDGMSVIIVNGKRGTINDLVVGMKVTGSAEITRVGGMSGGSSTKTVRMRSGSAPPVDAQAAPGAASGQASPQPPNPTAGLPGMPDQAGQNPNSVSQGLMQEIGGTFWILRNVSADGKGAQPVTGAESETRWFSLNANGTLTCAWLSSTGTWSSGGFGALKLNFGGAAQSMTMQLDHEMKGAELFSPGPPRSMFTAVRFDSPTQAMRDKVASTAPATPAALPGTGMAATAVTPTPAPVQASPETQGTAAEIVRANHANLVFVTGKEGAGSGFIANFNGANFLFTNAHVAAGINNADFKTLDGAVVKGGAASVAVGHDIFCMELPAGVAKPLEIMQGVDENAKIGDDVVVLGNAGGSGVINTIMGRIVGIGPSLVEIDAQFIPGNSGSPIIHLKSGKVIGVATYIVTRKYDATTHEKMATPEVRHYGYRIDSVKKWQAVNWRTFYAEADALEKVHALTGDLDNFFSDISENKGRVTLDRHTNPVIKNRIAQWQEEKRGGRSQSDRQDADTNFISFLKIACQSDITALQGRLTYDYFQRDLADEQETRAEMSKAFSQIIQDIQK